MVKTISTALWYLSVLAEVLVIARIVMMRAVGRYPAFFTYVSASVVRSIILLAVGAGATYTSIYIYSDPVLLILEIVFVVEAYRLTQDRGPSRGGYGPAAAAIAVSIAVGLGALSYFWDGTSMVAGKVLSLEVVGKRIVVFALGCFLVLARTAYLVPISERKNIVIHRRVATLYCFAQAVGLSGVATHSARWSALLLGLTCICWCAWAVFLRASGESSPIRPRLTEEEKRQINDEAGAALAEVRLLADEAWRRIVE